MIYSLSQLREYARSLDTRLEDTSRYNDTWLDYRIEEGIAIAQDIKPIFYTIEIYNMTEYFTTDGMTETEILLQKEPHSVYAVECDQNYFDVRVSSNNHIEISRKPNTVEPTDYLVTVRYFFYPTLPINYIEMNMEMYKLVKDGIAIACFSFMRDKENEQYHQAKAESYIIKSTLDIVDDINNIPVERLWRGSWA